MLRPPEAPVLIKVMRLFGPNMSPPLSPLGALASGEDESRSAVVAPEVLMLPDGFG
jgi:hypothetical protein